MKFEKVEVNGKKQQKTARNVKKQEETTRNGKKRLEMVRNSGKSLFCKNALLLSQKCSPILFGKMLS